MNAREYSHRTRGSVEEPTWSHSANIYSVFCTPYLASREGGHVCHPPSNAFRSLPHSRPGGEREEKNVGVHKESENAAMYVYLWEMGRE